MTDLSPRRALPHSPERESALAELGRRRRRVVTGVLVAMGIAAALVLVLALRDATEFFRNADEAIAERDELGSREFRLQGRVVPSSVTGAGGITQFEIVHNCASVAVRHSADPPDLFESPWIPVVLEGRWMRGDVVTVAGRDTHYFASHNMLIKHTNEYVAASEDRPDVLQASEEAPPEGFLEDCPFEVPRL